MCHVFMVSGSKRVRAGLHVICCECLALAGNVWQKFSATRSVHVASRCDESLRGKDAANDLAMQHVLHERTHAWDWRRWAPRSMTEHQGRQPNCRSWRLATHMQLRFHTALCVCREATTRRLEMMTLVGSWLCFLSRLLLGLYTWDQVIVYYFCFCHVKRSNIFPLCCEWVRIVCFNLL